MNLMIKQIKIRWDEILLGGLGGVAGIIFGVIISIIQYVSDGEQLWGSGIVTMLSCLMGAVVTLIGQIFTIPFTFNVAVGMSCTRKVFLIGQILISLLSYLFLYFLNGILFLIEKSANQPFEVDMRYVFHPAVAAGIMLGLSALSMFMAACILRFGNKVLWIFWAVWMAACLLPSRVIHEYSNQTGSFFDKLGQQVAAVVQKFTPVHFCIAVGIVIVLFYLMSAGLLLKQKVEA